MSQRSRPTPESSASAAKQADQLPPSTRKHEAILHAAEALFLRSGYLGTNMDELATISQVSKQTIYKHFGSKEQLFIQLVSSMTMTAGDSVHRETPDPAADGDVRGYLQNYAERQLNVVLTPRLLQLRRLVIGEVSRFPELAKVLYESGPQRAISALAASFEILTDRGELATPDPVAAATYFNWLVMGAPVNDAMLLGDSAVPKPESLRGHCSESVRIFLAAYGAA